MNDPDEFDIESFRDVIRSHWVYHGLCNMQCMKNGVSGQFLCQEVAPNCTKLSNAEPTTGPKLGVADFWMVLCIFNSRFDRFAVLGGSGAASSGHFRPI